MSYEELQNLVRQAAAAEVLGNYDEAERLSQEVLASLSSLEHADTERSNLQAEAIRMLGVVCFRRGDYSKALEHLHAALHSSEQRSDQAGIAKALGSIGNVHNNLSDYPKALVYYGKALSLDEELGDRSGVARHFGNIGLVHCNLSDYPKALEYYGKALSLDEELGNKSGVARHLSHIGNVHTYLSDYPKALEYFNKALLIDEELGNKNNVSVHFGNIGNVHLHFADYSRALEFYHKALSLDEGISNKSGMSRHLGNIGNVYRNLSDYPKALEYHSKARGIAEGLADKLGEAINLSSIGKTYIGLSDYPRALEYLDKALGIAEELGNKTVVAANLGSIGNVHEELSDHPKALEYYGKAYRLSEETGNKKGVEVSIGNIGIVHLKVSDDAKALECFTKALNMSEEIGNRRGVAIHLGNIGVVHMKLSDYSKAQEFLERGMHLHEELGMKSQAGEVKGSLGELHASDANPNRDESKAEAHLLDAIAVSEELGTKKYYAHKTLADLYEKQKRWQKSHYHLGKYFTLEKEVQSEEARKKAQLMEQQKQIAEREKEIAIAKAAADAQMSATTTLLYKVLPQTIATRLIKGEKVADYFRDVSVLFADIVGFTPIASRMPAKAVLAFLNFVFGEFDRIIERNGCEKIKTIGDGYLAVAGAPVECSDHAERITRAALEMMGDIILPDEIRKTIPKGAVFSIRIGIHMGPCFAGIVGENRFVYDIYSDAVNIAARMESHGEAGKIHVSDEFCFHLQNRMDATGEDFGGIRFDEREEMEIKGKGLMRTYFLERA